MTDNQKKKTNDNRSNSDKGSNNNSSRNNNNNDDTVITQTEGGGTQKVHAALTRLAESLKGLGDINNSSSSSSSSNDAITAKKLSHWRNLTPNVETAYKMMQDGAQLIKATSTKYTLVGKINLSDADKLANDLLKGCELIGTGTLVIHNDDVGCGRSSRDHARQHGRAVVNSVLGLLHSFIVTINGNDDEASSSSQKRQQNNVENLKTGIVWSTCDEMMKIPKGNRNAMRRDLFTWAMEANETMQEFTEMIQLGPAAATTTKSDNNDPTTKTNDSQIISNSQDSSEENDGEKDDWDDFLNEPQDQYTAHEIPIAEACLALIKCSRGTVNVVLKACECAGEELATISSKKEDNDDDDNGDGDKRRHLVYLEWISQIYELVRIVGEGVTNLGTNLYPPLELMPSSSSSPSSSDTVKSGANDSSTILDQSELGREIQIQTNTIIRIQDILLDAASPTLYKDGKGESCFKVQLTKEVIEMATKLRAAAQKRSKEAENAINKALHRLK